MKSWIAKLVFSIGIISLSFYLFARFGPGIPISSIVTQKQDLFTVSGEGKATGTPNLALVNLGVQVQRPTVKAAQDEANRVSKGLTDSLTKIGIDKKDIQTVNYNLYPNIDYTSGTQKITNYSININFEVKIHDFDKLNQAIDSATAAGANQIGGLNFTFDDKLKKELENKAREEAVKTAREKAESLAKVSGLKLGRLVNVQENFDSSLPIRYLKADSIIPPAGGGGIPTTTEPGQSELSLAVTLTFETR